MLHFAGSTGGDSPPGRGLRPHPQHRTIGSRPGCQSRRIALSDQDEPIVIDDGSAGDRPLVIPAELPVLPLRDTVLFPNSFMPLAVAREASVRLIDEATTSGG